MNTPTLRKLTVAQWIAVPDYPITHPKKRNTTHLKTLLDQHTRVIMATLPGGSECKIDGHVRAIAWRDGITDRVPDDVYATVFDIENQAKLEELYRTVHSR